MHLDTHKRRPVLRQLGTELTKTSFLRLMGTLTAPFIYAAAYFYFISIGQIPLAVLAIMALSFVTYGSISHDLVHRNLGLPIWLNDALLFVIELGSLRSGTAYRLAHLHHHRVFPHPDDVEAYRASQSLLSSLLDGLWCQYRMWGWAWRHPQARRGCLVIEGIWFMAFWMIAMIMAPTTYIFLGYAVLVVGGSWFFPLITVYLPHEPRGSHPLSQTRLFRGKLFSIVFFGHLYHLEHHLYPGVPHHHWGTLAKRLDPFFTEVGVHPIRFPRCDQ